jgi:small-conductance mechanosensitive channel
MMNRPITNYFKGTQSIGRTLELTVDYKTDPDKFIKEICALIQDIEGVSKDIPVKGTVAKLSAFCVEYAFSYRVNEVKLMFSVDALIRKEALIFCMKVGYDLSTPNLIQNV